MKPVNAVKNAIHGSKWEYAFKWTIPSKTSNFVSESLQNNFQEFFYYWVWGEPGGITQRTD